MKGAYSFNQYDIIFNIYYEENGSVVFLRKVRYNEIITSQMNLNMFDSNDIEIKLQFFELYEEIYNKSKTNQIIIERLISGSNFNKIFFLNNIQEEQNNQEYTYILKGVDFKGFIENRRIIEHNVFYEENTLPIDPENGDKIYPDDFNKIKITVNFRQMIEDFYDRNIFNPVKRVKGSNPPLDNSRKIECLESAINWIGSTELPVYRTLQVKKSILEFKNKSFNYYNSIDRFDLFRVEIKIINNKLHLYYVSREAIEINDIFGSDEITLFNFERNNEELYNSLVTESSSEDFDYSNKTKKLNNQMCLFEKIEEESNEDGITTSLDTNSIEKLEEFGEKLNSALEIEFQDNKFLVNFDIGDWLKLEKFDKRINGTYFISEISEIIENDYVSYSIDKMNKIEEA